MTDRQYTRGVLRDMLNHYYENIGKKSKYTGMKITPRMVAIVTQRFLELGGRLRSEPHEINRENQ